MFALLPLLNLLLCLNAQHVDLGSKIFRTFDRLARERNFVPLTKAEAEEAGYSMKGECDDKHGVLWMKDDALTEDEPLGVYFTNYGQITGIKLAIFGEQEEGWWQKGPGPAAQDNLVQGGFWIPFGEKKWAMSIIFRAENLCSGEKLEKDIGSQLVVNPGGVNFKVPVSETAAIYEKWHPGSCMKEMGQHWFYDLVDAPNMSWVEGNVVPVVPMFVDGHFNAFLVTTPVCQDAKKTHWDNVPIVCGLTGSLMCLNWCSDECEWQNTDRWATYHFFFNEDPSKVECENVLNDLASIAGGRSCPDNTKIDWERPNTRPTMEPTITENQLVIDVFEDCGVAQREMVLEATTECQKSVEPHVNFIKLTCFGGDMLLLEGFSDAECKQIDDVRRVLVNDECYEGEDYEKAWYKWDMSKICEVDIPCGQLGKFKKQKKIKGFSTVNSACDCKTYCLTKMENSKGYSFKKDKKKKNCSCVEDFKKVVAKNNSKTTVGGFRE